MGEPARSHDVVIDRRRDRLLVVIDGKAIPVVVGRSPRAGGPRSPVVIGAEGGEAITAAMPGRVVKVLVRRGDAVSPGQPLVVVEAMKMQNELRATRAGIVTDVRVSEGAPVEARAILIVVGPAPDAY
jgi:biotin carboxyl carrier protein